MREPLVMRNGIIKTASAHAADVVKEREWQPIETAPLDQSVLIFIPSPVAEHYGPAIYRGLCVENMNHERVWKTSALHSGRDCGANYWPTHWMPLPEPPEVKD